LALARGSDDLKLGR